MYRLYLDTCILNDTFVLIQHESGEEIRPRDMKAPVSRWAKEYLALYYLLDLDDEWQLEFGTSEITTQEIARFRPKDSLAQEKKDFLEDMYERLYNYYLNKCKVESGPITQTITKRVTNLIGPGYDALQLGYAIQGGWDFFITTDFKTILDNQYAIQNLEKLVVIVHGYQGKFWPQDSWQPITKKFGIKVRSPLQFLEENLLSLPTLIRTLYGSWTDYEDFIQQTVQELFELSQP